MAKRGRKKKVEHLPKMGKLSNDEMGQCCLNKPVEEPARSPNTQASFEEVCHEIKHVEHRMHGAETDIEYCKDTIAALKNTRQELSDALAKKIREGLRASL